jgi:hypothetical protein
MFCDGCGRYLDWDAEGSADSQLIPQGAPQPYEQRAGVQLQMKTDLIKVAPGSAESTTFTVKNLGNQVEEFRCAVTGPDWITSGPATLSVFPGQEAAGTVQAAPPHQPSSVAGVVPFRLTATSTVHANVSSSAAGLAAPYELAPELVPTSSNGRGRHIITSNWTTAATSARSVGYDRRGRRTAARCAAVADVAPTVVEVPVSVYGTRRWFGRPEPRPSRSSRRR